MKTTINKEFFEKWKNKDVVMWCKKEEYAEEFCKIMHKQGLKWCTSDGYLEKNRWHVHYELTVYLFNTGYFTELNLPEINNYTILDFEDYIVKEKMTKQELVELLAENFINEQGTLDLSNLDFRTLDCDVDISGIKTRRDIYQGEHTTKGSIYQGHHITNKDIYQSDHITKGNIYQLRNKVGGELFQES